MKLKNIGLLQQHLEKIVLGVSVLAAGAIVYLFVLGGYNVEVNLGAGSKTMAPADIEKELARRASLLKQKIEADRPSLESKKVPEYHKDLQDRLGRMAIPLDRPLPPMGPGGLAKDVLRDITNIDTPFFVPELPVLADVKTRTDYAVLEAEEVLSDYFSKRLDDQGLARDDADEQAPVVAAAWGELIDGRDPRDFQYVSFVGYLDVDDLVERFAATPPKAGVRNIPEGQAMQATLVTDVVLERQTLNQGTGEWGATERLPRLPGLAGMRDVTLDPDDPNLRAQWQVVMRKVFENQEELSTPEFPPLAEHSRPWANPLSEEKQLSMDDRRKLDSLRKEIKNLRATIEREQQAQAKQRTLKRNQNRRKQRTPMGMDDMYGDMGGDFYDGGGSGRGRGSNRPTPTPRPRVNVQTPEQKAQLRIKQAQEKLDEKLAEYSELSGEDISNLRQRETYYRGQGGFVNEFEEFMMGGGMYGDPYGDMYGGYMPAPRSNWSRRRSTRNRRPGSPQVGEGEEGKIEVWAHDPTVKAGNVYRYRIIVNVLNPLYQRKNLPPDQHAKYFNALSLSTPASEWTEEVSIRPQPQWFLVDAKNRDQTATVEMWTIHNGRPEPIEFKLSPGDVIGGEGEIAKIEIGKKQRAAIRRQPKAGEEDDPTDEPEKIRLEVAAAVVDVHQPGTRGGVTSPIMRYVDLATGQVKQRSVRDDQDNADRIFYRTERDMQIGLDAEPTTGRKTSSNTTASKTTRNR